MSKLEGVYYDEKGNPLPCYGCGHSMGDAPYPGKPCGERPCLFCIRNLNQAADLADFKARFPDTRITARYDNGPVRKMIGDQYIATDRVLRDVPEDHIVVG